MAEPRRAVDHWLDSQFRALNAGAVVRRRSLEALLRETEPRLTTRDGEVFLVDRAALARLAAVAGDEERRALLLPVSLHFTADATNEVYLNDETAVAVLRRAEGWGSSYAWRDGRSWLPLSLGVELMRKYGGAVQALYL